LTPTVATTPAQTTVPFENGPANLREALLEAGSDLVADLGIADADRQFVNGSGVLVKPLQATEKRIGTVGLRRDLGEIAYQEADELVPWAHLIDFLYQPASFSRESTGTDYRDSFHEAMGGGMQLLTVAPFLWLCG
jgi:hypothetical protein